MLFDFLFFISYIENIFSCTYFIMIFVITLNKIGMSRRNEDEIE